ncbi:hypothetical protein [Bradyrhizobium iriomotense]|uniref:hypothetical protein n=1 Tax=Bradyrhizobium iriomotense TaxID=441950 RepID=UPI001B8A3F33|nr:hypothetical protein [Bradyrhizobium iriomotense]MBR0781162.1 hypothetical protein [Bradyrhizobium iriomotense]
MNAFILAILIAVIFFVRFADYIGAILGGILVMGALYVLRNAIVFDLACLQRPHLAINVSSGTMSIEAQRRELVISASNVREYYVYNNKLVLRAHALSGQPNVMPAARIRNGQFVVIYLY